MNVESVLGRPEGPLAHGDYGLDLGKILITGAAGSVGMDLANAENYENMVRTDIANGYEHLDVRDLLGVRDAIRWHKPDVVFHLAGSKHAPEGEKYGKSYADTNILGTHHVLDAVEGTSTRVVLASTCKACDPETVYGATKLVAERMTLEAGHSVARFHNIVESSGNVFKTWEATPGTEELKVTACERRFISMSEAVGLLLYAADARNEPGRYIVKGTTSRTMWSVAASAYPGRQREWVAPRRGDRFKEPLVARCETTMEVAPGVLRVTSSHDPRV